MTHAVNAHNMKGRKGLIKLEKNELLKISINFQVNQLL